ncbi:MAG: hypothetical protein V4710_07180 [Verrucomicrobiota bacterium]
MNRLPSFIAAGMLWVATACAQSDKLNLTPINTTFQLEGVHIKIVKFYSESASVEYSPPWPITGSPEIAHMQIPNVDAQADIERIQTETPLDLEDDEQVKGFVISRLPKEAEEINVEQIEKNPLKLNNKPTTEISLEYVIAGRRIQLSTLLAQRSPGNSLYLFSLSSNPAIFEKLHRTFRRSLYSITEF